MPLLGYFNDYIVGLVFEYMHNFVFNNTIYNKLFPSGLIEILDNLTKPAALKSFFKLPFTGFIIVDSHFVSYSIAYEETRKTMDNKDLTGLNDYDTIVISIADSLRANRDVSKNPEIFLMYPDEVLSCIHRLIYTVPTFSACAVVVQYINCLQQPDVYSCGLYTIYNTFAFLRFGNYDVFDEEKVH